MLYVCGRVLCTPMRSLMRICAWTCSPIVCVCEHAPAHMYEHHLVRVRTSLCLYLWFSVFPNLLFFSFLFVHIWNFFIWTKEQKLSPPKTSRPMSSARGCFKKKKENVLTIFRCFYFLLIASLFDWGACLSCLFFLRLLSLRVCFCIHKVRTPGTLRQARCCFIGQVKGRKTFWRNGYSVGGGSGNTCSQLFLCFVDLRWRAPWATSRVEWRFK